MQVSLNWIKQYVETDLSVQEIADILTNIGLEEEGIGSFETIDGGLKGLVVGEVLTCGKHPNATKLSLTTVDVGTGTPLGIVCGAPNVAQGQKVLVATIGTMIYPAGGDPFKIKKGKIRGEVSEGMICAEDELGLGNSHAGIMVLDANATVGMTAADYIKSIGGYGPDKIMVESDTIYEIGLTPNRSDATGHLGVAFDLAAALKTNYEGQGKFTQPDVSAFKIDNNSLAIEVDIQNSDAAPRYSGVCIAGVTVKESPSWLQNRLKAIGLTPKNNIVDITNFVLHELGQPLHAFDYDAIADKKVIVRNLADKTKFTTLDEVDRELSEEDLMICDGQSNGMCIAGVFGGMTSGVKEETTNIFLESAHFHSTTIRRTSMRHLLRTDAATRFEKGTDPNITIYALKRAALLIQELAGGTVASEIIDIYPNPVERNQVTVTYKKIQSLIGVEIPKDDINTILGHLDMNILESSEEGLTIDIPTNKVDVTRDVDVIEEILRIYGYNKVEEPGVLKSILAFSPKPNPHKVRNLIAELLTSNGFSEMMATSMMRSRYFKEILPIADEKLVYVNNTSNQHLDILRPSMVFCGLEAILHNQNRQQTDIKLYEFGKTYLKTDEDYKEEQFLTLFITGQRYGESWLNTSKQASDYYTLKAYIEQVLTRIGLDSGKMQRTVVEDAPFAYALKYHRGPQNIVTFGRLLPKMQKAMAYKDNNFQKIKQPVFYAEFHWDNILKALKKHKVQFKPVSKYPSVRRDLALVVNKSITFEQILGIAIKSGKKLLKETNLFDVYEHEEHIGKGKKSYAVSFIFQDDNKTLKDKDIDKIMNNLIQNYENKLSALIRK
ncbi:MAG: phenylalanine--tRNA ligase subunit beta [Aureispira sp.]|nr:phenylalanine--tRNA ligase subunit beta [Aureispira sp.]